MNGPHQPPLMRAAPFVGIKWFFILDYCTLRPEPLDSTIWFFIGFKPL
jgi:hypothetical protein